MSMIYRFAPRHGRASRERRGAAHRRRALYHPTWTGVGGHRSGLVSEARVPQADKGHEAVREGLTGCLARLWRYGMVLAWDRATAEDLVQATCVRALERSGQFTPGTRLDRWLFAILRSIWLNEVRARRIRQGQGFVDPEAALVTPGDEAETNILAAQVLKEIQSLPEAQRETVLLVY